ncbi:family 16 glycoside hydrolase [Paenibacillus periandrae]|uniref:family 16 glycoside hydrolase n=1 Tax=Paenibacillus periandrae TaxID=1761741 RepID=UPI001F0957CB|nr:family 16 glycoside hydrolase [Paenibacillus periandrae]
MLKRKVFSLLLLLTLMISITGFLPQTSHAAATIQNYPMPSIYTASSVFSLKADNASVPVISYLPDYDYAEFSFSGTVSIEVTASENITSYSISPMAKNIVGTVSGNKLTFSLSSSTYVIVKINDLKKMVIAADPLETDIPASSGTGIYNVTSSPYNADSTGTSMATTAIQKAIDDANGAGGGIVFVPAGVYKSGNLTLKSNVTFYLAGGAVIVGTGKGEDYVIDFRKDSRNADGTYFIRTAVDSSNITIRGRGTIDGKGIAMRERKMPAPNKNEGLINNLLVPLATTNFNFDGLILRDAGFWSFMVVRSDNVTIKNLKGFQDLYKIENDVIDINESQNVLVKHAIAISDDDTYSTKTWLQTGMSKGWPGALEHLENVVFDDAFAWTRCAAFKIGMGVAQPQIGVTIRNSYVYQSARALLIDHGYQYNTLPEEGYAQNITFENIDIERVGINQFGNYWLGVSTSTSGNVNNVILKNINVRELGSEQSRISGNATKGGMVNGVTFSDVYVKGKLATNLSDLKVNVNSNVSGIKFSNTKLSLFSDNFEDGTMTGWTAASGTWNVVTDSTKVLAQQAAAASIITAGNSWANYAYEAKMKLPISDANAGIIFRVQDASNYYMYRINSSANKLELYKCVGGTLTLVSSTSFTATLNQWYTVKAVIQGNNIKGFVDGVLKTDWTNPVTELAAGKIGFRTTSANVHFDDVLVTPNLLFSDNFEDGTMTGWTAASGTWNVVTDSTKVLAQQAVAASIITAGNSWTDYAYEAKMKLPISDANAGIIFRVQDASNYYMYRINSSANKLELYKCVGGTLTLVSSTSFTATPNQWYTVKAVMQGNNIKGFVDGVLKTDWTNPVTELAAGKIGFRTTSANVHFDDVLVTN